MSKQCCRSSHLVGFVLCFAVARMDINRAADRLIVFGEKRILIGCEILSQWPQTNSATAAPAFGRQFLMKRLKTNIIRNIKFPDEAFLTGRFLFRRRTFRRLVSKLSDGVERSLPCGFGFDQALLEACL